MSDLRSDDIRELLSNRLSDIDEDIIDSDIDLGPNPVEEDSLCWIAVCIWQNRPSDFFTGTFF